MNKEVSNLAIQRAAERIEDAISSVLGSVFSNYNAQLTSFMLIDGEAT